MRKEVRNPQYADDPVDNNFNLMFLTAAFAGVNTGGVGLIPLNWDRAVPVGATLNVVGWGDVDPRADVTMATAVLMATEVRALTNTE